MGLVAAGFEHALNHFDVADDAVFVADILGGFEGPEGFRKTAFLGHQLTFADIGLTGGLEVTVAAMQPLMGLLGLPIEAAEAFLFGFFRRDYGAAGLFDLNQQGLLSPVQLTVAAVTLTGSPPARGGPVPAR